MNKPLFRILWWLSVAPFGKAGRAAGELDVYRVVELQLFGERREAVPLGVAGKTENIAEPHHAVGRIVADR